jgi:hypothetical protein
MHPIERLRWIARAHGESPSSLATEAAWTLAELAADEPAAVLTACRRLLDSHVTAGPLWHVAARVLVDPDPGRAARDVVEELCSDPTAEHLAQALETACHAGETVVVAPPAETVRQAVRLCGTPLAVRVVSRDLSREESGGFGGGGRHTIRWRASESAEAVDGASLVLVEALAAGRVGLLVARGAEVLVRAAGEARVTLWAVAGAGRMLNDELLAEMQRRAGNDVRLVSPALVDAVAGVNGLEDAATALAGASCPLAPELLVRAG